MAAHCAPLLSASQEWPAYRMRVQVGRAFLHDAIIDIDGGDHDGAWPSRWGALRPWATAFER